MLEQTLISRKSLLLRRESSYYW